MANPTGREWVSVDLTHSDYPQRLWQEIRLQLSLPLDDIKERLYKRVGTLPPNMILFLIDRKNPNLRLPLSDNDLTLGDYGCHNGNIIHIDDSSSTNASILEEEKLLADKSTKHTISEEAYNSQKNTMRAFLKHIRAQRPWAPAAESRSDETALLEDALARFPINARCEVQPGSRRGVVKYVGPVSSKGAGKIWIGVSLDEPLGNTDGTDKGIQLFSCNGDKYGQWSRQDDVQIGDFPPVDPFDLVEI
ncbi:CAP-Gly domain-containing protein [Cardiosporidium cionae]|uniref:CAP-Gly domain-containing protein n=1 Tax=Cardiosporidium cionae TaxID=476202 RepID=A0ABQ7J5G5_9APIC|nr:CAP-Gly domain-containing protein [Cardiosporidium cionae]|eukprot:KAF8818062.1 CAP-Gly domain-containing protein [Cardiosporidium cionae]